MSLLETRSLTIGYREKQEQKVLQRDINVSIRPGEIISLMGQNGVGKTTFIKTVSGLLPELGGEVWYRNEALKNLGTEDLARKLSLVLTEKPFSFNISVLELIAIGRHPYSNWLGLLSKDDKAIIEWAISETHVNYIADKKLYQLSDGQLQKVMIARALAQETDLIILDEPAAHLDLCNKIEVMLLLRKIASQGKGILISTHDMQVSTQLSDKLWLFNFNEPVKEGAPEDLILDGTLKKTLFLEGYGYDMIHGTLDMDQKGPAVMVKGDQTVKFWTEQALKRNGFKIVADKAGLAVECKESEWILKSEGTTTSCSRIEELLTRLRDRHITSGT